MNICVLGCGMVGSAMALDLAQQHTVYAFDANKQALSKLAEKNAAITTKPLDFTDEDALADAIDIADFVISAVPGFLGFSVLKSILNNKKHVVDISFFPEKASDLDYLAKQNQVFALVDCGVAPGMDNILLGYHDSLMNVERFECLVGGLPRVRQWPFEYKAPFSPIDVIEEYTRPARYVENGEMVTVKPLTDCEMVEFDKVGTLEAFNTDGLRSLIDTLPHIPYMKEKTLRYPGHAEYIRMLDAAGFFSEEPIEIDGVAIRPIDFSGKVLIDNWKLRRNDPEFTVMRVTIEGTENNKQKTYVYSLYDETDREQQISSMARTTGYTATASLNFLIEQGIPGSGVFAPETFGALPGAYQSVLKYLESRNVHYKKEEHTPTKTS